MAGNPVVVSLDISGGNDEPTQASFSPVPQAPRSVRHNQPSEQDISRFCE